MKKKVMILLSVVIMIAAGCGNKKTDVATSVEPTESVVEDISDTEKVTETETTTESVEEETEATETDNKKEQESQSVNETSESNAPKQTESNTQKTSNDNSDNQNQDSGSQQDQQQTEPAQTESTPQVVSYSPQNVVSLATAKTKAAGKVLLTENLDNLLANGQISQEEYNEYYPYDGAGYYSVFVDTNMAEARSVSGTTNFNSEDDIAQYISDMLVLENGPYFLIEYAGTYDYYGKQCYEFRCYRA